MSIQIVFMPLSCVRGMQGQPTVDTGRDCGEYEDEEEIESKKCQWWCLLRSRQVVQKAGVWDDRGCKQAAGDVLHSTVATFSPRDETLYLTE